MMKNYLLVSALLFSFFSFSQQTEDVEENRRWDISMSYKLGNGKQYSQVYRGLNGSVTAGDFLLTYTFLTPNTNSYFRVSTGISMIEFNTNLTFNELMLHPVRTHQSSYLQVPLRFGSQIGMFNQDVVRLVADFGFAGNYHLETILETSSEREIIGGINGWTFAFISTIGFDANVSSRLKVGIIADIHSPIISDEAEKNYRLPLQAQLIGINFKYML